MSLLAQVAVEGAVYHFDKLFTYQVPQSLAEKVRPGVRVMAPFGAGNRERVAMVFAVGEGDPEGLKPLREVLDREPALPRNCWSWPCGCRTGTSAPCSRR